MQNRKRVIVTSVISIVLVCVLFIGNTLSIEMVEEVDENLNYYSTGNLDIIYSVSDLEVVLNNSYPLSYEDALLLDPYRIVIYNNGSVSYKFSLSLVDETETDVISYDYIMVKVGCLDYFSLGSVSDNVILSDVIVEANDSVIIDLFVWLDEDMPNSEIGKGFYADVSIDGEAVNKSGTDNSNLIYNLDGSGANRPVLDDGMVPVYYDYDGDVWRVADSSNIDSLYQWYDYDNYMWANVVMVKDDGVNSLDYYLSNVGSVVNSEDIIAFFVWIPRFKYRVFNLNRSDSSYEGYVDIRFENGVSDTGNVSCSYDSSNSLDGVLSDSCYLDGELVTLDSVNNDDSWYSHPAFSYDGDEVSGFWVGKFETTGSFSEPTILPDSVSLVGGDLISQFNSSLVFNSYGISDMEAHMARNIEWGAIAMLYNSLYGVCRYSDDGVSCASYSNNSSGYYTGSGSLDSDIVGVYGSYNYQGYLIDSSGSKRSFVSGNRSLVIASSTLNIYGVYDLVGGANERVMGVSIELDIDSKYYDLYAKGDYSGDSLRSILGDGTVEYSVSDNYFIYQDYYNFIRGSAYNESNNIFKYNISNGTNDGKYTYRVVLS